VRVRTKVLERQDRDGWVGRRRGRGQRQGHGGPKHHRVQIDRPDDGQDDPGNERAAAARSRRAHLGWRNRAGRGGIGCRCRRARGPADEPVAARVDRLDVLRLLRAVAEQGADVRHDADHRVLRDGRVAPDGVEDLPLADDLPLALDEQGEQGEAFRLDG
jgi:hypothetical protein